MTQPVDDLWAPLGADQFFAEYAGRRPAHLAGAPAALALPGWPEIAELLNMSALWSAETLLVLKGGEPVAPEQYCEPVTDRDLQPAQRPLANRVLALHAEGNVVIARHVETLSPAPKRIDATLEAGFGVPVAAELHLQRGPFTASAGIVALADLLLVPLAGATRLRVRAGAVEHPVQHPKFAARESADASRPTLLAAELGVGDRVYVPRGAVYELDGLARDVAYVVFAIARPVGLDLLHALRETALDDPFFRADLPRAEAEREAYLAEIARRFGALVTGPHGTAALAQLTQGTRRDLADYNLPVDGPAAAGTTRYRRNASRLDVVETPQGWQLRAARGAVPIPPGREQMVAWIVARAEFSDDELGAAFPETGADLLATLLRDLAAMKVIVAEP